MKTNTQSTSGAVLMAVVLSMIAAALIGAALLSMATSARYERVTFGVTNRAYYLAESGAAYVRARSEADMTYPPFEGHPPITNTFPNGDQFIVTAYRTNVVMISTNAGATNVSSVLHTIANSVGIANPGTALESRQQLSFDMVVRGRAFDAMEELSDALVLFEGSTTRPDYNDAMFNETGTSKVEVKDTGPSKGIAVTPKLDNVTGEGHLALSWQDKAALRDILLYLYQAHNGLLSYDVQVKPAYFPNVPSSHFMMGLSFRLHDDNGATYGLSFFRSQTNSTQRYLEQNAPWVLRLDANFNALRGTNFYAVLWYTASANGTIQLINSRRLPVAYLYLDRGNYELKYYNTLLLQLKEAYAGEVGGGRINQIVAYMATTNTYPGWPNYYTTNAVWQENTTNFPSSTNAPIVWDQNPYSPASGNRVTNIDSRITSAGFYTNRPSEIGLHLFYDRSGDNETYFRDFSIRFEPIGTPFGGTQIQW